MTHYAAQCSWLLSYIDSGVADNIIGHTAQVVQHDLAYSHGCKFPSFAWTRIPMDGRLLNYVCCSQLQFTFVVNRTRVSPPLVAFVNLWLGLLSSLDGWLHQLGRLTLMRDASLRASQVFYDGHRMCQNNSSTLVLPVVCSKHDLGTLRLCFGYPPALVVMVISSFVLLAVLRCFSSLQSRFGDITVWLVTSLLRRIEMMNDSVSHVWGLRVIFGPFALPTPWADGEKDGMYECGSRRPSPHISKRVRFPSMRGFSRLSGLDSRLVILMTTKPMCQIHF